MTTINLQRIGDNIFPTDFISRQNLNRESFKVRDLDVISPRLVKNGFILRIADF